MALGVMSLTIVGCRELVCSVAAGAAAGLVTGVLVQDYYYQGVPVYCGYRNERYYNSYYRGYQYRRVQYYYYTQGYDQVPINGGLRWCSRRQW